MDNNTIILILKNNGMLKSDNTTKKSLNIFLYKPQNVILLQAIFNNTSFVVDSEKNSIRERIFCIINNITVVPTCGSCSNNVAFRKDGRYAGSYGVFCSRKCVSRGKATKDKKIKTTMKNLGVANPFQSEAIKEKSKLTMMDKYGVNYPLQNDALKILYKKTCIDRYGVDNPIKSPTIREKSKHTNLIKYGVDNPFKSEVIKDKIREKIKSKYGVEHIAYLNIPPESVILLKDRDWLLEQHHTKKRLLVDIASELDVTYSTVASHLTKHSITIKRYGKSLAEQELFDFVQGLIPNETIICNSTGIISPFEIDIYIPKFKLAIEYNGIYWHSEAAGKTNKYHLNKTELCEKRDIRLIHIFEDEWNDQSDNCKATIRHLLGCSKTGVYARKTKIMEISWKNAKTFLAKHHLLGAGTAGNYRIGAFNKHDELIGVMVFGIQNNEYGKNAVELKRFVTDKRNNPGLGSKMFKYAVNQAGYDEVVAFVDRRWFTGLVKTYIGFKLVGTTPPAIWWTDGKNRYHRRFITKKILIKKGYDENMSKREILESIGYSRIWDSGKLKLRWNRI